MEDKSQGILDLIELTVEEPRAVNERSNNVKPFKRSQSKYRVALVSQ